MNIFNDIESPCETSIAPRSDTILDNLKRRKLRAEDELAKINGAIEAMEKNPEVTKVLELIAKV